jgi:hypothetical protein
MLLEAKAKFFDLQRAIEQLEHQKGCLIELRTKLVKDIEELEKEPQLTDEGLQDEAA